MFQEKNPEFLFGCVTNGDTCEIQRGRCRVEISGRMTWSATRAGGDVFITDQSVSCLQIHSSRWDYVGESAADTEEFLQASPRVRESTRLGSGSAAAREQEGSQVRRCCRIKSRQCRRRSCATERDTQRSDQRVPRSVLAVAHYGGPCSPWGEPFRGQRCRGTTARREQMEERGGGWSGGGGRALDTVWVDFSQVWKWMEQRNGGVAEGVLRAKGEFYFKDGRHKNKPAIRSDSKRGSWWWSRLGAGAGEREPWWGGGGRCRGHCIQMAELWKVWRTHRGKTWEPPWEEFDS